MRVSRTCDVPAVSDFRSLLLQRTPLIDVRAPVEFARGAIPGAVNLPLMSDEERHLVGIEYKRAGQQAAIELGATLVSEPLREQRIGCWVEFSHAFPNAALYCFRGGLRSRITQQWLTEAGVRMPLVTGGYKALRSFLIQELQHQLHSTRLCLIGGRTAVGKTCLLEHLASSIDLEALARHRGSSFGGTAEPQPSNIDFEHAITLAMMHQRATEQQHVFLEDEGRMIGRICMPEVVRQAMSEAPIVVLEASMEARVEQALQDYVIDLLARYQRVHADANEAFDAFAEHHLTSLARVQKRLGGERYQQLRALGERALAAHRGHNELQGYRPFIARLLHDYYDPMYDYQLRAKRSRIRFAGNAEELVAWLSEAGWLNTGLRAGPDGMPDHSL